MPTKPADILKAATLLAERKQLTFLVERIGGANSISALREIADRMTATPNAIADAATLIAAWADTLDANARAAIDNIDAQLVALDVDMTEVGQ